MTTRLAPQLNYLPTRNGGEDQLHTHGFNPSEETKKSCGACAQLANDFVWLRFNDAVAAHRDEFRSRDDVVAEAEVDARQKLEAGDLRAFRDRGLAAVRDGH